VPDAQSTLFRPSGPQDLDHMGRELSGRGWVVRFEPHAFAPGTRAGHLVLTRPRLSTAELIVACPRRHELRVWVRTGQGTWSLGTVADVDEVSDLLRRHVRAPRPAPESREGGVRPAAARTEAGSPGAGRSRVSPRRVPTSTGIDGGSTSPLDPSRHPAAWAGSLPA
jgi:hypothetical protein